jgi:pimeloyl-ACP methyl ester carboxylesterase
MLWPDATVLTRPLRILLPSPDAATLADPAVSASVFGCQRDAFTDVDGLLADAEILAEPWGFRPEEIGIPTHFWHGDADENFHHSLGANLARRIPDARFTLVEGEGHFSLAIRRIHAVLAALGTATETAL